MVASTSPPFSTRAMSQPSSPVAASSHQGRENRGMEGSSSHSLRYASFLSLMASLRYWLCVPRCRASSFGSAEHFCVLQGFDDDLLLPMRQVGVHGQAQDLFGHPFANRQT